MQQEVALLVAHHHRVFCCPQSWLLLPHFDLEDVGPVCWVDESQLVVPIQAEHLGTLLGVSQVATERPFALAFDILLLTSVLQESLKGFVVVFFLDPLGRKVVVKDLPGLVANAITEARGPAYALFVELREWAGAKPQNALVVQDAHSFQRLLRPVG